MRKHRGMGLMSVSTTTIEIGGLIWENQETNGPKAKDVSIADITRVRKNPTALEGVRSLTSRLLIAFAGVEKETTEEGCF